MNQDTEITQKPLSTTKEYTRGSLKSLICNDSYKVSAARESIGIAEKSNNTSNYANTCTHFFLFFFFDLWMSDW